MSTRGQIARGLLWFAAIWWGVWFGGQLFNALMVVPYFSADVPESLRAWGRLRGAYVADFFVVFNSLWILLALATALVLGRRSLGRSAAWAAWSAVAALVSVAVVVGWMYPTIARLVSPDTSGLSVEQMRQQLHDWTVANWMRLGVEASGFVASLVALARVPDVTVSGGTPPN